MGTHTSHARASLQNLAVGGFHLSCIVVRLRVAVYSSGLYGSLRLCRLGVKVDFPLAAPPPSWWPILSDLPRLPASFFFSLQYEETRAVQGFRTFLPVVPSYRSSLWAVIVIFWAVFEFLVLAPIRPSDRRLRSAGRDRVFPSSSFSDPLSVREIGEAMKVEAEVMQRQFIVWAVFC
ncbi:hypothetical protein ACOSQ4_032367 [Xanthoceras sorbifolium]